MSGKCPGLLYVCFVCSFQGLHVQAEHSLSVYDSLPLKFCITCAKQNHMHDCMFNNLDIHSYCICSKMLLLYNDPLLLFALSDTFLDYVDSDCSSLIN